MLELQLDNKNGNVWDIESIVTTFSWSTYRIGKSSKLEFKYLRSAVSKFEVNNGDIVRCVVNGVKIFLGYVFSCDGGSDEEYTITCYDQTRYLMNKDSYVLVNVTATDVIKRIAKDFELKTGQLQNTEYIIPKLLADDQSLMDIIWKALTLTLNITGRNYMFFDDFGELVIRDIETMLVDFYIGAGSLLTSYSHKQSIDSDTYNVIKLYKDNEKAGTREIYLAKDSNNIAKWGKLQLYQSVDEGMNEAQIKELLSSLSTIKNRETKSLKVDAVGDFRLRAGNYIRLVIIERDINQLFLIDECTHDYDGSGEHTMTLELKVV
ncbi:XkdQ/YqbQ family protein [Paenibacillus sinopodophylli]|uniref:XkdQ/YqbQ family protein n=1 Tax=Paenibacillus sinopodophylli TaxID=1837342 RepID=UPI00110D0E68|nr:hypothetical protein [Paenibacillus sinopodophylli]